MNIFRFLMSMFMNFLADIGIYNPIVFYYGCPNSKKAKKLQLEMKLFR